MIECDDVDKKNNEKCKSPAKWKVKKKDEKEYIHPRCGRHSRNMDKILIENTNKIKSEKKKRGRKTKLSNNEENNELKINIEKDKTDESEIDVIYSKNSNNKEEKIKTLFRKIDELCDLLNEKIHALD
jgi:hypothetical protein